MSEIILIVIGLALFEIVSSLDNAVINAEVLSTTSEKAKKWFLLWGMVFAVFVIRGILPLAIVWLSVPDISFLEAFRASFTSDETARMAIENSAPLLLLGGGIFLALLFLHWLFLEEKDFGLPHERFFQKQGIWFYAMASILLSGLVYNAVKLSPMLAFAATIGSTAFFIIHGFKENAEKLEEGLIENSKKSDFSKILYLEAIDATFSIDGVLGAFAFTMSIPLILIGNGLGAIMVRQLTIGNINHIKKYKLLKNGAMYSIGFLGSSMILESFGAHIPSALAPTVTILIIGYFFLKSKKINIAI